MAAAHGLYHAVVLDLGLPGVDGMTIADRQGGEVSVRTGPADRGLEARAVFPRRSARG